MNARDRLAEMARKQVEPETVTKFDYVFDKNCNTHVKVVIKNVTIKTVNSIFLLKKKINVTIILHLVTLHTYTILQNIDDFLKNVYID